MVPMSKTAFTNHGKFFHFYTIHRQQKGEGHMWGARTLPNLEGVKGMCAFLSVRLRDHLVQIKAKQRTLDTWLPAAKKNFKKTASNREVKSTRLVMLPGYEWRKCEVS